MGFPDHPSDQDRQGAPNMHVPPDQATTDYQPPGGYRQTPGYPEYPGYPGYPAGAGVSAGAGAGVSAGAGRVNGLSVAALVCGLAQFLLWFLLLVPGFIAAVLALIFGAIALGQIKRRSESGRGFAITGIVLGVLGVLGGAALGILLGVGAAHYHGHMGY